MATLNATESIVQILLGGLLGIVGQGIRIIVGLRKLSVDNTIKKLNDEPPAEYNFPRIFISLFIGFIAGALCALIKGGDITDKQTELAIVAAGYSGADAIEGLFKPYLPK